MKTGKFIISAVLVFALANYAYGMGGHHHRSSTPPSNNGGNVVTYQASNDSLQGDGVTFEGFECTIQGITSNGDGVPDAVPAPEPMTMLLLGSGLLGLWGCRKKFRK